MHCISSYSPECHSTAQSAATLILNTSSFCAPHQPFRDHTNTHILTHTRTHSKSLYGSRISIVNAARWAAEDAAIRGVCNMQEEKTKDGAHLVATHQPHWFSFSWQIATILNIMDIHPSISINSNHHHNQPPSSSSSAPSLPSSSHILHVQRAMLRIESRLSKNTHHAKKREKETLYVPYISIQSTTKY